jgi:hypothetical protein
MKKVIIPSPEAGEPNYCPPVPVIPLKLETGHPLPTGRIATNPENEKIREVLKQMKPATGSPDDQSFLYTGNRPRAPWCVAKMLGMKLRTQKVNGGIRIWRKS